MSNFFSSDYKNKKKIYIQSLFQNSDIIDPLNLIEYDEKFQAIFIRMYDFL